MKLNTPWVKDIEKGARKDYEYNRSIMEEAIDVDLPDWDDLPLDTRNDLEYKYSQHIRDISDRPVLTLKAVSADVWSTRSVLVLAKETYTHVHCFLGQGKRGVYVGQTGAFKKLTLKEVSSFDIQWIHTEPEFKLRLIISFTDYSKETIEGAETVFKRPDLMVLHDVIRESAQYMSYYDKPMPKLYY